MEDISAKTGSFKKFPVFVKMLLSGLKQNSTSVFIDLLTYADLEQLRAKKTGQPAPAAARAAAAANKRYLIVTYAAEFDRVHYPLPLQFDDSPDPKALKVTIVALRRQLEQLQADASTRAAASGEGHALEMRKLREDNYALRQEVKRMHERAATRLEGDPDVQSSSEVKEMARELKNLYKERQLLTSRMEGLEAEAERQAGLHRRELRRKAKEAADLQGELQRSHEAVRELRLKCRQLADELDATTRRRAGGYGGGAPAPRRPSAGHAYLPPGGGGVSSRLYQPTAGGSSRPTYSAGSSRASSRDASPRQAPRPSSSPRPSSAPVQRPAAGRFDPTEYIRQKRERDAEVARRLGRTPPRSGNTSGNSSRPGSVSGSRAASPSGRVPSYGLDASWGRQQPSYQQATSSSAQHYHHQQRSTGSRPTSADRSSRAVVPRSPSHATSPRAPWSAADAGGAVGSSGAAQQQQWSKFPIADASVGPAPVSAAERATSPGAALQEVKKKLSEYVSKKSPRAEGGTSSSPYAGGGAGTMMAPAAAAAPVVLNGASAEIADIDQRLQALQNFLKLAKTSSAAASAAAATKA